MMRWFCSSHVSHQIIKNVYLAGTEYGLTVSHKLSFVIAGIVSYF